MSGKLLTHKLQKMGTIGSSSQRRTWGDKQPLDAITAKSWIPKCQESVEDR